jgi:F-type H+-transporting ATPase subunit gamma
MPNLKDIQTRIRSVKKTRQITSAMKLVASAKLKRATDAVNAARPYQQHLEKVLRKVAQSAGGDVDEPLLDARADIERICVVVLTTDRGLCGGFNNNLIRQLKPWMQEKVEAGAEIYIRTYGRKGAGAFKRTNFSEEEPVVNWTNEPRMDVVSEMADTLTQDFIEGRCDQVYLVYNEFVNVLTQTPRYRQLLPIGVEDEDEEVAPGPEYRFEPTAPEIVSHLLPLYVRTVILQGLLETGAGSQAARMTAMDNATRNADDLINDLTLQFNRARQAAITTEIIEIVSGAQALGG